MTPSERVLDLFAVPEAVTPLEGSSSVVAGDLVLSPGCEAVTADWLSPLLARLAVRMDERPRRRRRDLRLAVPVPARDGSWVVDGWGACRYEPGTRPCAELEVQLAAGRALHGELAVLAPTRPAELDRRHDRRARAERLAVGPAAELRAASDEPAVALAAAALDDTPLGRAQLVHTDLQGTVLVDAAGAPVVIDVSPAWAPPQWAEAVCVLDSVTQGETDAAVLARWTDTVGRQAMLRAVAFRALGGSRPVAGRYDGVLSVLDA